MNTEQIIKQKKIILLGSLPNVKEPATFGGATILFKSLKDFFDKAHFNYKLVLLTRYGRNTTLKNLLYAVSTFFIKVCNASLVFINVSSRGVYFLAPIIILISKLLRRKIVLRLFGSNFKETYVKASSKMQYVVRKVIKASDLVIVETQQNVSFFKSKDAKNVFQLPNVRQHPNVMVSKTYTKKFIFISHVKHTKGVDDIIAASKLLDANYTIDVYGPIMDNYNSSNFKGTNVNYKGALAPDAVIPTLLEYDVVLLPTFYNGEGHPGILVEALSIGMPIIATEWSAIPDIVAHQYNGLLVPIKSPKQLAESMQFFNTDNYPTYVENAAIKFKDFEEESVYKGLVAQLNALY